MKFPKKLFVVADEDGSDPLFFGFEDADGAYSCGNARSGSVAIYKLIETGTIEREVIYVKDEENK